FYAMLKHDGILIIDQRNYDTILDNGFSSKHSYNYCGEDVVAEPEYMDEGLARFRYRFPDNSEYYLNMFPLRKDYMRRLLTEVGFQQINTYGDFQETYSTDDPDFFVHIAEKAYREDNDTEVSSVAVRTARDYYNSTDADTFYYTVWGGEDIHVGLYADTKEDIAAASRRTVQTMADKVSITEQMRVLDVGAGFGGAARYLAHTYGCHVSCLNLSELENERNRQMNAEQGVEQLIEVVDGSFESLSFPDDSFDVVWSQDAFLHSGDRVKVLQEIKRVLAQGGQLVFTDPMAVSGTPKTSLQPILDRIHLSTMGSPTFYQRELERLGMTDVVFDDHSRQLPAHYGRVLEETEKNEKELLEKISSDYVTNMKTGLRNWVNGGNNGHLAWGIFTARLS
ncbi:MAG: SAM-dependent methyltransferase, partial [Sciscionella sp.]